MKTQTRIASCAGRRPIGRQGFRLLLAMALSTTLATGAVGAEQGAKPEQHVVKKAAASTSKENVMITPPESPKQLWERLLKLLAEDNGFTPKDRVEVVLGVRFTHAEKDGELRKLGAAGFYKLTMESPRLGLFKVGLYDDPKSTDLSITWGQEYAVTHHCLSLKETTKDLQAMGWVIAVPRSTHPGSSATTFGRSDELARNKELGLGFDTRKGNTGLDLWSPNQFTDCVNGFTTTVWRNPTR